jgi:ABC-type transport system involved in multi-copper enzyme maturation permease subunit
MIRDGVLRNAVVGKELRTRMRGWRSTAVLTLYMAILGVIAIAFLVQQAGSVNGQSSQVGLRLFQTMAIFQLFLILFVTPASTAGAISGERQRQTWDLLLVTRLSSFGIVWGKLVAGLAFDLLLIMASLPLFSLVFLFGGVAPEDILHTYIVFLATVVLLGVISLCVSALTRRLAVAMIVSNLVALLLGVGVTLLALYLENWGSSPIQQFGPRGPIPVTAAPLTPLAQIDPLVGLASALPDGNGKSYLGGLNAVHHAFLLPLTLPLWEVYALLVVALSILLIVATTVLVRSTPSWLRAAAG